MKGVRYRRVTSRTTAIDLVHGVRKAFASTSFSSTVLDHLATDPDLLGVPGVLTVNVVPLCVSDGQRDLGSVSGVASEISLDAIDESLESDDLLELERLAEEQDLAQGSTRTGFGGKVFFCHSGTEANEAAL